jgi:hypothetical protein
MRSGIMAIHASAYHCRHYFLFLQEQIKGIIIGADASLVIFFRASALR